MVTVLYTHLLSLLATSIDLHYVYGKPLCDALTGMTSTQYAVSQRQLLQVMHDCMEKPYKDKHS